jgi:hypothetical protein
MYGSLRQSRLIPLSRIDLDLSCHNGRVRRCREAVVEGDNIEYWQLVQAKLVSMCAQPGSSQQQHNLGEALNALTALLQYDDHDHATVMLTRIGAERPL